MKPSERPALPWLLSDEFRPLYLSIYYFLIVMGTLFLFIGIHYAFEWRRWPQETGFLTSAILSVGGGLAGFLSALTIRQLRRYFHRIHEADVAKLTIELTNIKEQDFEKFDEINQIRQRKAEADFQRNLGDAFLIKTIEMSKIGLFGPFSWHLRPGVNVLLGRNGYGKSLLLRSLAALLQRNEEASKDLFDHAPEKAFMQLAVERNGSRETIRRESNRFTEAVGKIPILAIPDSRFVSRRETSIAGSRDSEDALDLRADGASHFLDDRPYGEMMGVLFNELCLDYLELERSRQDKPFEQAPFKLLQSAIESLTGDSFRFHSVERVGRNAFRLLVQTEGNDRPVPIQYASQGTLSVLGVVGIIRSYLRAVFPKAREDEVLKKPALVLIDELDAHLHPLWQQKLTGILRTNFPNVQFVLSAHSPLVVAGCWMGEVSVLRKKSEGFVIEQLERDFLGTPVDEIYRVIFGVEDLDESYLESATRAVAGFDHQSRISELELNKQPTEEDRRELSRLVREQSMAIRAKEVKAERQDDQGRILELEAKVSALEDELHSRGTAT